MTLVTVSLMVVPVTVTSFSVSVLPASTSTWPWLIWALPSMVKSPVTWMMPPPAPLMVPSLMVLEWIVATFSVSVTVGDGDDAVIDDGALVDRAVAGDVDDAGAGDEPPSLTVPLLMVAPDSVSVLPSAI